MQLIINGVSRATYDGIILVRMWAKIDALGHQGKSRQALDLGDASSFPDLHER
jgi:hypothetical protein